MDRDQATRQTRDDEYLVKAFVLAAERLFESNKAHASFEFFSHASEEECAALNTFGKVIREDGSYMKRMLNKDEVFQMAEIFTNIATRANQKEWLKKALPMKAGKAAFSLRMMEQGVTEFAMFCCPISI